MASEAKEHIRKSTLTGLARWSLRAVVLAGSVFTIWVIVGSIWFPEWWSAAIFDRGLLNVLFLIEGFKYLLGSQTWLLFCLPGLCLVIVVAALFLPQWRSLFVAVADRWAFLIIAFCATSLIFDALVLYKTVGPVGSMQWIATAGKIEPTPPEPEGQIEPPIDFIYLDNVRLKVIYSEIEPELVEQRRTLSAERKLGGSASIGAGGAALKAETSQNGKETSEYQRSEFSLARKCIELVNFALKKGSAHYYTTKEHFYHRPGVVEVYTLVDNPGPKVEGWATLLLSLKEAIADEKLHADQLFKEEASGFVVVEGEFHISRSNNTIQFEEEFSPRPQRIVFHFTLPASADSDLFRDGRTVRVFGDVTQRLDSRGVIEIHPLAVY